MDKDRKHSDRMLKTEEVLLLPTYLGRRTSRIRIEEVPPEVEVGWAMAALCHGRDDKLNILQISRVLTQQSHGQTIKVLLQAAPDVLENFPNWLFCNKGQALKVEVEGRKAHCFKCNLKGHVRVS